jgi:hypothetical protein
MSNNLSLILSSARNTEYLQTVINDINENLYKNELFKKDRIVMETQYNEDGEVVRHVIIGSETDFFQIGLRYGQLVESKREKLYAL